MSNNNGYSISYNNKGMIAVGISRLEKFKWRIERLEQNQADAGPSESFASEMIKNSGNLTMVAPGAEVRTSLVSLPKLKKKEMGLAAAGWVAREESTTADEWAVSWSDRDRDHAEDKPEIMDVFLLYAARKDVERQLSYSNAWGGDPSILLPEFMILDNMYRRYGLQEESLKGWNVVFVGKEDHFLCVSTPSGILMTRPLPADLSDGRDKEEYLNRLATEVDRSIFFARQTEFNPNIEKIIVCGDSDLAQNLVERLKEETSVPAEFWDVAEFFEWEGGVLEARYMLPAMAAVVNRKKCSCNLLPPKSGFLLGATAKRRLILASTTAAVAVIPIFIVGGIFTASIQDGYLTKARKDMAQAEVWAADAEKVYQAQRVLLSRENYMSEYSNSDQDYAGVLLHLAELTPEEIIYSDLRFKESAEGKLAVYLTGESKSSTVEDAQRAFLKFKNALDNSDLLVSQGEARKLNISVENSKGLEIKKVEFSMEYQVHDSSLVVTQNEEDSANGN